jgi:hypothetical protein
MANITKKNFDQPDDLMKPAEKIQMATILFGETKVQRFTGQPGWQWSKDLKAVFNTESCPIDHLLYVVSGGLHVKMDNGEELDFVAGDIAHIPPGHDGWSVGNEPTVWLELAH